MNINFEPYKNQILYKQMPCLERLLGPNLFHESYPKLEKQFWDAVDAKDARSLWIIYELLNKEIDRANGIIMAN